MKKLIILAGIVWGIVITEGIIIITIKIMEFIPKMVMLALFIKVLFK